MDPYIVLGVPRRCTHRQVKEIFRESVRRDHPGHGGDEQKFIMICAAYKQIIAQLDSAVDSATSEHAAHQNLINLLQRVSARSIAEDDRSRPVQTAGAGRSVRGDSGAMMAGLAALMIFLAEVLV